MKDLIIVESPTKAKIIEKFLQGEYRVVSSMGHVRDLPGYRLGVRIEENFEPEYVMIKKQKKLVADIEKLAEKASMVYLAMDEDREGEAIGWHLLSSLSIPEIEKRSKRIVFHEVTLSAIQDSLKSPRKIDMNLVDAQQARRILDRIVGYKISPLLSRRIRRGLSAGRVQSVGLRMIVERERERLKFTPRKYYTVAGEALAGSKPVSAELWGKNGKKLGKFELKKDTAEAAVKESLKSRLKINNLTSTEKKLKPSPPFITSTLQQDAYNRLKFTPSRTMRIAQQLYEGVEISGQTAGGLITYMRTDSFSIAAVASKKAAEYIKKNMGKEYYPPRPNSYKSRKSAQEAHECIRPTDISLEPDSIKAYLTREQGAVYRLIWERFISSQMSHAIISRKRIDARAGLYDYRINGQSIIFDGFMRIWPSGITETSIPEVKSGDELPWNKLEMLSHETKPPARFTLATLVSELEKNGIGRPSTYATIINTLLKRKYIISEKGSLIPEEIGMVVIGVLEEHFSKIVDYEFTAQMEDQLDDIASGKEKYKKMLRDFYEEFVTDLKAASDNMEKLKDEKTDESCPDCGAQMLIKWGRNGKFMACSSYPKCRRTYNIDDEGNKETEVVTEYSCPRCSEPMIIKSGRFGKFLACSTFPKCKASIALDKEGKIIPIPLGYEKCPKCEKDTAIKSGPRGKFLACTGFPKCRFSMNLNKTK